MGPGADLEARAGGRREDQEEAAKGLPSATQARNLKRTKEVQKRPEKGKKSSGVTQPSLPLFNN